MAVQNSLIPASLTTPHKRPRPKTVEELRQELAKLPDKLHVGEGGRGVVIGVLNNDDASATEPFLDFHFTEW